MGSRLARSTADALRRRVRAGRLADQFGRWGMSADDVARLNGDEQADAARLVGVVLDDDVWQLVLAMLWAREGQR